MPSAESLPGGRYRRHGARSPLVDGSDNCHGSEASELGMTALTSSIPSHPLRVKPLGNRYLSQGPDARAGVGAWRALPDEVLMLVLELFDASELRHLGSACKFLYAFCHLEELWKAVFLQLPRDQSRVLEWRGSWRRTVLALPKDREARVDCGNVYSDVLHRPFACTNIDLEPFASNIPKGNQMRRFDNLTYDQFAKRWTEEPFILTNCIRNWPICSKWSIDRLLRDYDTVEYRAEAVDWTLARYCDYMKENNDESPLYLFDRKFVEKMGIKTGPDGDAAYWRPGCFGPDLFEVLGRERPAHRWLIVGPQRSGSTFHKDPNGTSAWNAVVQGAKYWIMFPPGAQVPGVYVSSDSSEVTSPLSIAEWLLTFHDEARQMPDCVEGVCLAGEIVHVPSGWWHLVVNLKSGIAVTQNFVPLSPGLKLVSEVLSFLRDRPDQVSGFPSTVANPYELFAERLGETYSETLGRALELADRRSGKKRKWDTAVGPREEEEQEGTGFSFGFRGEEEEEEEEMD